MAREHLSGRDEWQGKGVARGAGAEDVFHAVMRPHLTGLGMEPARRPSTLSGIYGKTGTGRPHGIRPEYEIHNPATGKRVWVEIKRQRAAGNAHERTCKHFMPGIVRSACEIGKHPPGVIPFWLVFTNGIARDPIYRQEITHWFRGCESNVMLWRSVDDHKEIMAHFDTCIAPLLE